MNTVYVLGAGASKALNPNAPLMNKLLPHAMTYRADTRGRGNSRWSAIEVAKFITRFYTIEVNNSNALPPFEDVLSQIDYCLINSLPLSDEYGVEELRKLRKHLVYVMGRVIQRELKKAPTNEVLVAKFIDYLDPTDSIISLNYDLVVDNAVTSASESSINYGIPIRNLQATPASIYVYKLHGSLNWTYCPVCREVEVVPGTKGGLRALYMDKPCPKCGTPVEPILITPSFLKDYNNSFIVQIWHEAQLRLHNAREVVFVGYSLPDADIVLRMFFNRSLYTNRLLTDHEQQYNVRVIDFETHQNRSDVESTKKRYRSLFGEIDFDASGFEAYISRGCRTANQDSTQN